MFSKEHKQHVKYVIIALVILILILTYFLVKPFIIAILSAIVLSYIFYPLYKWFNKFIKNESIASAIVSIVIVLLFLIPLFIVLNILVRQSIAFYITAADYLSNNTLDVSRFTNLIYEKTGVEININSIILTFSSHLIDIIRNFLASIPEKIINFFVMLFMLFYLFKDGEKLINNIKNFVPFKKSYKEKIFNELGEVTHAVVFGHVLAAFAQGIVGIIGFYIFGINSPIFWGLLMIFFGLVPFIGTPIIWVPASLFLVFRGLLYPNSLLFLKGVGLFLYGLFLISTIDNIIRAKIGAGKARIHPVIIFLGVLGGLASFGIIGIIIGPVILSLFIILLKFYKHEK